LFQYVKPTLYTIFFYIDLYLYIKLTMHTNLYSDYYIYRFLRTKLYLNVYIQNFIYYIQILYTNFFKLLLLALLILLLLILL